jgi:hypothetical protein
MSALHDWGRQRGSADGLVLSPARHPPPGSAKALFFPYPRHMTVISDRLWIADGTTIRCFALSLSSDEKKAAAPALTSLLVKPIDGLSPDHISVVVDVDGGARLFVSGSRDRTPAL